MVVENVPIPNSASHASLSLLPPLCTAELIVSCHHNSAHGCERLVLNLWHCRGEPESHYLKLIITPHVSFCNMQNMSLSSKPRSNRLNGQWGVSTCTWTDMGCLDLHMVLQIPTPSSPCPLVYWLSQRSTLRCLHSAHCLIHVANGWSHLGSQRVKPPFDINSI